MAIASSHCEAKKHGYRQTQDGIVVSFVLHPNEVPDDLALAALGTRYVLALARIGDDEEPQEPEKPKRPGTRFADMPPSQQAGMLCDDLAFQQWVCSGTPTYEATRSRILVDCCITSRRDLDHSDTAHNAWIRLLEKFRTDTGRTTEQRG